MKILFITRKFPPQVGGMERHAYGLFSNLKCKKKLIALKYSRINLVWFIPYAFIKALFIAHKFDLIYFSDGVLAPIGTMLRFFTRKPIVATIHGLEVTFENPIYKVINLPAMRGLDLVTVVSNETRFNCIKVGIDPKKIIVIPNGIEENFFGFNFSSDEKNGASKMLAGFLNRDLENKIILLTVGRLVKRKGVSWFIKNVLPSLDDNFIYLIVGDGSQREKIKELTKNLNLDSKVIVAGKLSDELRNAAYRASHIFLMPNIRIRGDQEGFGITAIEAALAGLPVIASGIEGIKDAVIDGKTGYLLQSGNSVAFTDKINNLTSNPQLSLEFGLRASEEIKRRYNWKVIASIYTDAFLILLNDQS